MIHTFLITLECKINGAGGERKRDKNFDISNRGGGEVWGTLKLKYFLRITEKMEKVTSDGHLFSNLFRKFRVGFSV